MSELLTGANYSLVNLLGKTILSGTLTEFQNNSNDLSYLPNGNYFLKIDKEIIEIIKN